jgi:hypothetical protein
LDCGAHALQAGLLVEGVWTQLRVSLLQVSTVQGFPSLHDAAISAALPQESSHTIALLRQAASALGVHAPQVPSVRASCKQVLVAPSQKSAVQGSESSQLETVAPVAPQAFISTISLFTHAELTTALQSLQSGPVVIGRCSQERVAALHMSVVQGFPSSQPSAIPSTLPHESFQISAPPTHSFSAFGRHGSHPGMSSSV